MSISDLSSAIARDPQGYREEIAAQATAFRNQLELIRLGTPVPDPDEFAKTLALLTTIAAGRAGAAAGAGTGVGTGVGDALAFLPDALIGILEGHLLQIPPDLRMALLKAVIVLVNRDAVPFRSPALLSLYCGLLKVHDKPLRARVLHHIVTYVTARNERARAHSLNAHVQAFLATTLQSDNALLRFKALQICCELFNARVWNDEATLNIIADALLASQDKRAILAGLHFLLLDGSALFDSDDEDDGGDPAERVAECQEQLRKLRAASPHAGDQSKNRRAIAKLSARVRRLQSPDGVSAQSFSVHPYDYLRDPYAFVERLLAKFLGRSAPFPLRLLALHLAAKIIAYHSLYVPQYYTHVLRYLAPRQADVTKVLEYLVLSVSPAVPDTDLLPVLLKVANDFIHAASSDYNMTVGINAIAEVARRSPDVLTSTPEGVALLNELVGYSRDKRVAGSFDGSKARTSYATRKGAVAAARSLLNFYRLRCPQALDRRYHDREAARLARTTNVVEVSKMFVTGAVNRLLPDGSEDGSDGGGDGDGAGNGDAGLSKHMRQKLAKERSQLARLVARCRERGVEIPANHLQRCQEVLGPMDSHGNRLEQPAGAGGASASDDDDDGFGDGFELEEIDEPEDLSQMEEIAVGGASTPPGAAEGAVRTDLTQRLMTDEELAAVAETLAASAPRGVDLEAFVPRAKLTRAEKTRLVKESKDGSGHKGTRWSESVERKKAGFKSLSNVQKEKTSKNMMMLVHSKKVRGKQLRSKYVKEKVQRTHHRNMKRGITRKCK